MNSQDILQEILDRLNNPAEPREVIAALLPRTRADAVTWARRLSGWDEYRRHYPDQVIAVARLVSKQAMRTFELRLTPDGRVVNNQKQPRGAMPERTFRLAINGEDIQVDYTPDYFPADDTALFSFTNTPPKPHCLSETGYQSQFVPRDAVDACGGPEAFAAQFAEAKLQGTANEFLAAFEGKEPEPKTSGRKAARPGAPPAQMRANVGEHTARLIGPTESPPATDKSFEQGMLF